MEKKLANLTNKELEDASSEIHVEISKRYIQEELKRQKQIIKGNMAENSYAPVNIDNDAKYNCIDKLPEDVVRYIYDLIKENKRLKEKEI